MGCDIHFYVEVKDGSGVWKTADTWEPCEYEEGRMTVPYEKSFYSGRNYDLFGILANVRNGYGFAGCDTGDGFVPISEPRGLPEDVSPEVKAESDSWDCDGHSHSHITLQELQAYDWQQKTKKRGVLSIEQYLEWQKSGESSPQSWCGGVGGPNVVVVPEGLLSKYKETDIKAGLERSYGEDKSIYIQCEWGIVYADHAEFFVNYVMKKMAELGNPEDVRAVFWFDN